VCTAWHLQDQAAILDEHNKDRAKCGAAPLTWDNGASEFAANYAVKCLGEESSSADCCIVGLHCKHHRAPALAEAALMLSMQHSTVGQDPAFIWLIHTF